MMDDLAIMIVRFLSLRKVEFVNSDYQDILDPKSFKATRGSEAEQWLQDRVEAIIGALLAEKDRRIKLRIGKY